MSLKGSQERYGPVAIAIHWVTALAIFAMLVLGFMAATTDIAEDKAALLRSHVPLGVLTFVLTLFRIVWYFLDRRPLPVAGLPSWQDFAKRVSHFCLYALIVLLGASGIGLMVLSGAMVPLFSGGDLPDFRHYAPLAVHALAAFALLALVALHIAAALYHQFIRRDRLLARMGIGASEQGGRTTRLNAQVL